MALSREHLIERVETILEMRERGDFVIARVLFDTLSPNDIPDVAIKMANGIEGDRHVLLFYINHDWENDYADSYLVDLLNAIDGEIGTDEIKRLIPARAEVV